jgi:hypothetical protein
MSSGFLETKVHLGDITEPYALQDWPLLLLCILIIDILVIFIARFYPDFFGKSINVWYDNFHLLAVIADVFIIAIGFLVARYIYAAWLAPTYGFVPMYFLALLLSVQLVHDILFYVGVIRPIPYGHNEMIDVFKDYAKENGWKILLADAGMVAGAAGLAMVLKEQPAHVSVALGLLSVYTLPYILFTRNKWSP